MIAKVRIASVERWCEWVKDGAVNIEHQAIVGAEARIITESCSASIYCDGKRWIHEPSSVNELRVMAGRKPRSSDYQEPDYLCEHMLEMD